MSHSKESNRKAYLSWKERTDTSEYHKKSFHRNKSKIYERSQKSREELDNYIIIKYLRSSGWDFENITPELIRLKRAQITLNRTIKWQVSRT